MYPAEEQASRPRFWEERTGWSPLKKLLLLEPLAGGARWTAAFGSLLLFAFVLQVVTGVLLAMNYAPSAETAWPSVQFIQEEVPLGGFIRALHHWGSSAMVILLLVHLVQVFVWGAYKRPREFTWMVGVLLLFCTLGLAFTGYLLPWDQKAYWATNVGLGMASTVPGIGDSLRTLLQGGPDLGNLTLTRFFTMHGFVLPGTLILLVVVHVYLFRLHGVTPSWGQSEAQLKAKEEPFWPRQAFMDGVLALVFLAALGLWCYNRPAPLEEQADPSKAYEARPEWYFMFLFQLLRYFHGPYEMIGTFVLPLLFFLVLFFWPFLDRSPHRDPRRRPIAIGLLVVGTVGLVGLTIYANATDVRMRQPELAKAKEEKGQAPGALQQADVAKLYGTHCAMCHGVDGTGNQVRAGLRPTIPDFTQWAWQSSHHELEITDRIQGGSGPLMPAYRDLLTQPQILALAIYVREFSATPVGPGAAKPAPAPHEPISHAMPVDEVYRNYCLGCHDTNGSGKIGRTIYRQVRDFPDFTDPKWQRSRQDKELRHSILEGKGQFMLPMKDKLSPADADRMVALIRQFQGGKTVPVQLAKPPVPPSSRRPKVVRSPKTPGGEPPPITESEDRRGRVRAATGLYRQYCFLCHGVDGRGREMRSGMPKIPDFTSRSWQEGKINPQLAVSILDGKELMPSFRGRFEDDQAKDLVAYIRAFGPARAAVKEAPPDDFEKRFRQLQDEWDELQKQLDEVSPNPRKP